MATKVEQTAPAAGSRFVEFDEFIDYQVGKASRGIRMADILTGVVGAALGICSYLLLFILCDHWLIPGGFSVAARIAFWALGLLALAAWLTLRVARPLRRRVNTLFAARQIERTQPDLKSSLLTLIDLKQSGRATAGQIRTSLEKRAAVNLSKADVEEAVDRGTLMNASYALLAVLAVFCGYALFSPKSIAQSAWRALVPFSGASAVTRTRIDKVAPGSVEVPALSRVDIEVELSGVAPEEVALLYTTADGKFRDEPVALRDSGEGLRRYRGTLLGEGGRGLRQSLTYHVVAGDAVSDEYRIAVVQPPSAIVDNVHFAPPAYMGLAEKTDAGGAIDAWEGTRVTIQATANMPVKSGLVLFSDSEDTSIKAEEIPLSVTDGTKLAATWPLEFRADGSFPKFYRLQVRNEAGHFDPEPALHPIRIRPDLPPKLEVLHPKGDVSVAANGTVSIAYRASDPDFQLRSVVLHLEREGQELPQAPQLFYGPPDRPAIDGVYPLHLAPLNLAAGTQLTWWLEARDNLEPFGRRSINRTVSPKLNIEILDVQRPEQAQQQAAESQQGAEQALDQSKNAEKDQTADPTAENGEERPDSEEESASKDEADSTAGDEMPPADGQQEEAGAEKQSAESEGDKPQEPTADRRSETEEAQPDSGDRGSEKETGEAGERGQPDDAQSTPSKGEENGADGERGKAAQKGREGEKRDGQTGSDSPSKNAPGKPSSRGPALEDEALEKLMEWDRKKREQSPPGERSEEQESANESTQDSGDPAAERGERPKGQTGDGAEGVEKQQPGKTPQTSDESERSPQPNPKASEPMSDREGESPRRGTPSPKERDETRPKGAPRDPETKPSPDNRSEENASAADEKGAEGTDSERGKEGEGEPMPADPSKPSDGTEAPPESTAPKSQANENTAGEDSPPKPEAEGDMPPSTSADKPQEGPPNSDRPSAESSKDANSNAPSSPSESASEQESATPREQNPAKSGETTKPKQSAPGPNDPKPKGESSQAPKGKPTSGQSNNDSKQTNESSKTDENRGRSNEDPVGQSDEGARSGGEGNEGSSKPGKEGDQTSSGGDESGKGGDPKSSKNATGKPGGKSGGQQGASSSKPSADSGASASSDGEGGSKASDSDSDGAGKSSSESNQGTPKQDSENPNARPSSDVKNGPGKRGSDSGVQPEGPPQTGDTPKNDSATPSEGGDKPAGQDSEKPSGESGGQESQDGDQPSSGGQEGSEKSGSDSQQDGGSQGGKGAGDKGGEGQGSSNAKGNSRSNKSSSGSGAGSQPASGPGSAGGPGSAPADSAGADAQGGAADSANIEPDPVNLEHKKKAAGLALKRLQKTLERGGDDELKEQLGFSDEQLDEFMRNLEERLADTGDDQSAEAQARRRQFESLLQAINPEADGQRRDGGDGSGPAASGFSAPRRPAPPEYKALESQYRQKMSRSKTGK